MMNYGQAFIQIEQAITLMSVNVEGSTLAKSLIPQKMAFYMILVQLCKLLDIFSLTAL